MVKIFFIFSLIFVAISLFTFYNQREMGIFQKIEKISSDHLADGGFSRSPLVPLFENGSPKVVVFVFPIGNNINGQREIGYPVKKMVFSYPSAALERIDDLSPTFNNSLNDEKSYVTVPKNTDWRSVMNYRQEMQEIYSSIIPDFFEEKPVGKEKRDDFVKFYFLYSADIIESVIRQSSPDFFRWLRY